MKQHRYHITVQKAADTQDNPLANGQSIAFEVDSHDDLHDIVERTKQLVDFDDDTAKAFVIGLKLLGGVMLAHRGQALFAEFAPHFGQFMRELKDKGGSAR